MNNSQTRDTSYLLPAGIFFSCAFVIAVACYAAFENIRASEKIDADKTLISIGQLKAKQIQSYLSERKLDAAVVMSFLTTPSAQHWLTHQCRNTPAVLNQLTESVVTAYQYRGLLVLDAEANICLRTSDAGILTEAGKAIARSAMRERSRFVSKIYFGDPSLADKPVLDTFVPVLSPGGAGVTGMIVMRSEPDFMFQLLRSWPVDSRTAESLLVTKDGGDVLFLNDPRHHKGAAARLRFPLGTDATSLAWPAISAATGHFGLLEANDYRGASVLAYTLAVPDTPWSMVAKIDKEEVEERSNRLLRLAMVIAATVIILTGNIIWLWWRKDEADKLANTQLQESESRYRRLHESMMDAYAMTDMSGRFLEFNRAYQEMLGYSTEELLRLTYVDLTPNKWHEFETQLVEQEIIPHGKSHVYEKEYIRKDGTVFPVEVSTFLLRDKNNQPEAMWAIVRDITERKLAEEELNRFFSLVPDLVCIASTEGRFLKINSAWQQALGYTEQEILATPFLELVHPDDRDATMKEMGRQLAGEATIQFTNRYRCKYGGYKWLEWRASPALNKMLFASARDITERMQAEDTLRFHSQILENLSEGIFLIRAGDGTIVFANSQFERMFGYDPGELVGKQVSILNAPDKDNPDAVAAAIMNELAQSGRWSGEIQNIKKDGNTFWCYASVSTFDHLRFGRVWVAIHKDITERKTSEKRMRELSAYLQTVREEEKASIAREIHDDLGGTLTALKMEIYWLAEELSASKESEPFLRHVELMSQLADNAVNVTRRVITGLRPTVLDDLGLLAALEWQAGQFYRHTGIICRVNSIEDQANLDRQHSIALFRIFQEALTNVARHSGASRVEVEFHCNEEEVMLSVSDNGRGLPDGHAVSPTSYGLRGMRERVEQLDGKLNFDKPAGGGFCVTVTLPLPATNKEGKV